MLSTGNGQVQVCVSNLLKLTRGEVPYERVKGINPHLFGQPATIARQPLMADIEWLLETFEPRADITSVDLEALAAQAGDFAVTAAITIT